MSDEGLSSVEGWSYSLWRFRSELVVIERAFGCLLWSLSEGLSLSLLLVLLSVLLPSPAMPVSRPDEESLTRSIASWTQSPPSGGSLLLCFCSRQLYLLTHSLRARPLVSHGALSRRALFSKKVS